MAYLIQMNLWFLIAALLVGFVTGAWMWTRRRHRVALTQPDENAPFARTLERAPMPQGPAPDAGMVGAGDAVLSGGGGFSPFLDAPQGDPDDLRRLKGVGPKLHSMLGELGVFHYHQIASWSDEHVTIIDERLGSFRGRIHRDRWREQARLLAEGRLDEFEAMFGSGGAEQPRTDSDES